MKFTTSLLITSFILSSVLLGVVHSHNRFISQHHASIKLLNQRNAKLQSDINVLSDGIQILADVMIQHFESTGRPEALPKTDTGLQLSVYTVEQVM